MLTLPKKNDSVKYDGVDPVFEKAAPILSEYFMTKGLKCLVTSAKDGAHSKNSAHYKGQALDLRSYGIRNINPFCNTLAKTLNEADLPGTFYVVWETDHIHLEWAKPQGMPNIVGYRPGKYFYDGTQKA